MQEQNEQAADGDRLPPIKVNIQVEDDDAPMPLSNSAKLTQGANTGGLNLADLGEDDENEEEELQIPDEIEVEVPAEERYKVLLRQVDMQLNTFGASAESGAAAGKAGVSATQVDMKTLISLATPNERCMLLTGWIFSALTGFVIPSFIFMLGPVFDAFNPNASKEESLKQVGMLVALMGGLALFVWIAAYMSYYLQQKGATRAVRHIRRAYFESVLRQESAWFDQVSYSQLATNVAADCSQIEQGIGQKFGALVQAYGMSISGMFLAFLKGWSLALPMLLLVPILSCGLKIFIKNITAKFVISATAFAAAAAACDEAMSAIRIVVAFGMEQLEVDNYMRFVKRHADISGQQAVKTGFGFGIFLASMYSGYSYAFCLGAIWVDQGVWNHTHDRPYSAGDIISVFFGVLLGVFALGGLAPNMQAFIAAKTAGKRTFDIIWRKPKIDIDDPTASEHKLAGEIKFENVNFHYPSRPDQHVLKDFSWTFEQGKTTAIVGASGSGKSTIVQLIERFYDPTDGTILVDGKPMNSIKLRHLRSQIGYVGQEPVLFNTSIKNNILLGRPTADEEEIKEALMSTNAYDFVMKQPEGMNTEAGSGGSQLSGGEKQRIALSRAFIKKPKLLIFDEATSALDKKNESEVIKSIETMKKELGQVTTIVIAHRLSTVVNADHIIVMKKGKITEFGNHRTLLTKGGVYATLVANQEAIDEQAAQQQFEDVQQHEEAKQTPVALPLTANADTEMVPPIDSHRALIPADVADAQKTQALGKNAVNASVVETELDRQAAELMKTVDEELKKLNEEAENSTKHITMGFAKSRIKGMAGPCFQKCMALLSSILIGAVMPFLGFFIIRCLFGVTMAQFNGENGLEAIYVEIIIMFSMAVATLFIKAAQQISLATIGNNLAMKMRRSLYERILRKQMSWQDEKTNAPAVIGNMLNAEVSSLQTIAIDIAAASLEGLGGILIGLVIAFIYSWPIALCILGIAPLMMLSNKVATRVKFKQWGMMATQHEELKQADIVIGDSISNFKTVASIAHYQILVDKYDAINQKRCQLEAREANCEGFQYGFSEFMKNFAFGILYLIQALLVYYFEGAEALRPDNMFLAMFSLMFGVFGAMGALGQIQNEDKAVNAARKMFILMDKPNVIDTLHPSQESMKRIQKGTLKGKIEFRDVWFRYPSRPGQWVFKGLNLTIEPNEVVAVVGESGAGKSTFISLVMRFYDPERGTVLIDDVDVKDYNIGDLRRAMGLVMQEPALFNFSIKDNILYGTLDASNQEIRGAAEIANALEFVETNELSEAFEDKPGSLLKALQSKAYKDQVIKEIGAAAYDSKVESITKIAMKAGAAGELEPILDLVDKRSQELQGSLTLHQGFNVICGVKGNKLSGGQKQRVAIARAVVRQPKILLLDEATSALDEISQAKVQKALENVMQNRTSIVVAHRLTTVEKCSRVAVIQDGQIVEQGKLSDLKQEKDGYFANLAAGMQKKQSQQAALVKKASSMAKQASFAKK